MIQTMFTLAMGFLCIVEGGLSSTDNIRRTRNPIKSNVNIEIDTNNFVKIDDGFLCDDGFGIDEARMICKVMTGSPDGAKYLHGGKISTDHFSADNMNCPSNASSISDCEVDLHFENCASHEGIRVLCGSNCVTICEHPGNRDADYGNCCNASPGVYNTIPACGGNDTASLVTNYDSCTTRLFENFNQGGRQEVVDGFGDTEFGSGVFTDNRMSSFRVISGNGRRLESLLRPNLEVNQKKTFVVEMNRRR